MYTRPTRVAMTALGVIGSLHVAMAQLPIPVDEGCWSSNIGGIVWHNSSAIYNSDGSCGEQCVERKMPVMALQFTDCWCGTELPPVSAQVDSSECSTTCSGYKENYCGSGNTLWSVQLTGLQPSAPNAHGGGGGSVSGGTSTGSGGETPKPHTKAPLRNPPPVNKHASEVHSHHRPSSSVQTVVTISQGTTVVRTIGVVPTESAAQDSSSSSSSGSKAGIAAGVVVGIVALAAIIGGVYLYLRSRKRKALEKSHRRQSSINAFAKAQKAPHMSVHSSQDSRLDPVIAARRQSDGSIADNQDFSRRVLKVTNPDDRW